MTSLETCSRNKSVHVIAVDSEEEEGTDDTLADLEELGNIMVKNKRSSDKTPPKMLTSTMRSSLTKQVSCRFFSISVLIFYRDIKSLEAILE